MTGESMFDLMTAAPGTERDPLWWLPLAPTDHPLVRPGAEVAPGDALVKLRFPIDRSFSTVEAVVGGWVRSVDSCGICVQTEGLGVPGSIAFGESVRGRLMVAVPDRFSELRASSIDISVAGTIIVAGARVGLEALTRARTLGARGMICGGISGRELSRLTASDARQRAALRGPVPFALVSLDGYGGRPISSLAWRRLRAAADDEVALGTDPPMIILKGRAAETAPSATRTPGARRLVRVTSGPYVGREGRVLDLRGMVGSGGMGLHPAALVALAAAGNGRPHERRVMALADLERLD